MTGWIRAASRLAAGLLLAAGLSACAALERGEDTAHAVRLPDPPSRSGTNSVLQREHQRIVSTYGGAYENAEVQAYIRRLLDKLAPASERPDLTYQVTLLNSPSINAFSLPSGNIYLTRGLLALANDGAELSSVLAHEMAHVIARHALTREDQAKQAVLVSQVVSQVLDNPAMGQVSLARSQVALASFSRAQELEADGIGVGILARANVDPYGASRFLSSLSRIMALRGAGTGGDKTEVLSSHPSTPERVQMALNNARQFKGPGSIDPDKARYLKAIDGLTYGDDPTEGYARGRRFLHPKLGFTFEAPPEFVLENSPQAVIGLVPGGGQALRLDVVRVPAAQGLAEYLTSGWITNIDPTSIESFMINGFVAASGTARGDEWTFRVFAVRFGGEVYRFIYAARAMTPQLDRAFRDSVASFRRLADAEAKQAKPLKVKVVEVKAEDTLDGLAGRMAIGDRPLERFLILNGLEAGQAVKPKDLVKLIVE